jgi:exopolyphosphatase / guanosine-5'-triphosphate,3'-diphosphate pyrophosphatase
MIIASIDIGTNTVLLLITRLENGKLYPLLNEYRIPRLGKGLQPGNEISQDRIDLLFEILEEYKRIIESHNCDDVILTGTYALRSASNSSFIKDKIKSQFGYNLDIVDGSTEAQIAFLGATSNITKVEGSLVVIDIGGGSTELIFGKSNEVNYKRSFSIGSVNGTENFLLKSPPDNQLISQFQNELSQIFSEMNQNFEFTEAVAIAGTPTTVACMCFGLKEFSEAKVENSLLHIDEIEKLISVISKLTSGEILKMYGNIVKGREDIILAGAIILLNLMKKFQLTLIRVSSRGIRYGAVLYKYLKLK